MRQSIINPYPTNPTVALAIALGFDFISDEVPMAPPSIPTITAIKLIERFPSKRKEKRLTANRHGVVCAHFHPSEEVVLGQDHSNACHNHQHYC